MRERIPITRWLRWLLGGAAAGSAFLLLLRVWIGPYRLLLPVNAPLNLECVLAVSLLLYLLSGRRQATTGPDQRIAGGPRLWPTAAVIAAVCAAYAPVLFMPLVTDDYIDMRYIRDEAAPTPLYYLTRSCGGPQVYRPAGLAVMWAEWRLFGNAAMPRHLFDLLLQAASSVLFLLLARRLGMAWPFDVLVALLFAGHGIRPEVVSWPGVCFDALSLSWRQPWPCWRHTSAVRERRRRFLWRPRPWPA